MYIYQNHPLIIIVTPATDAEPYCAATSRTQLPSGFSPENTLHKLLYEYYNSRVVPDVPASVLPSPTAPLDSRMHRVELDGVDDGADDPDGCLDASAAVGAMAADVEGGPVGASTSADHSADDDSPPGTQFSASH